MIQATARRLIDLVRGIAAGAVLALGGCTGTQAACPRTPADAAGLIIDAFADGEFELSRASALLGVQTERTRVGSYWQLRSPACELEIVLPNQADGTPLPEAELRLPIEAGLHLADIQQRFGPGNTVFESKTSSVRFDIQRTGRAPIVVFVRLFSPSVEPASPVTGIILRRAPASDAATR